MNELTYYQATRPAPKAAHPSAGRTDPFEPDRLGDQLVVTSARRLQRLAIVAAETGARFTREGLPVDPAAWLLAPRRLFEGRNALEACQDLSGFVRATLLHGLSMGVDAHPAAIDALMGDDYEVATAPSFHLIDDDRSAEDGPSRLFTGAIEADLPPGRLTAYCAGMARSDAHFRARLRHRYGAQAASEAKVSEGYDPLEPLAKRMVAPEVAAGLAHADHHPDCPSAAGLTINLDRWSFS